MITSLLRALARLLGISVLLPASPMAAPARDDEDQPTFKLVVSDAPKSATAGDPQKAREDRVKQQVELLQQRGRLSSRLVAAFGADRDIAIPLLRKISGPDTKVGRAALEIRIDLKDPEARPELFAAIAKADAATLGKLQWLSYGEEGILPQNAEEEKILRSKLETAFHLQFAFVLSEMPGVADLLLEKLPTLDRKDQWWTARILTREKLGPRIARSLLDWARVQSASIDEKELKQLVGVAAALVERGDAVGAEAEQLALSLFKKAPDLVVQEQGVARPFARGATKASRDVLERMVKDSRDQVIRAYALAAIARMDGPPVLDAFASEMRRSGSETWDVLEILAEHGHRTAADAYVLKNFPTLNRNGVSYALRHGGPEVIELAVKSAPKLEKDLQFEIAWKARNHQVEAFFTRLKELDLIPRLPTADEIKEARAGDDGKSRLEASAAMNLLALVGGSFTFDAEADVIPPPYDELLTVVSQFTRGAFSIESIRQSSPKAKVSIDSEEEEEELGPPINVKIVSGGKLFDLTPARMADWFDLGAVQGTVDRAIEVAGRKERLIPLNGWSQEATFVFGPPEAWQKVATEFAFPIDARSSAVEKGRDYERHAIDTLKDREKK